MIPVILGTVRSMSILLGAGESQEALAWIRLLVGFDVIFLTAGFLIFDWVIES
jgi:general stress protein CsbA